jgi:L-fuconolactonase
MHIIDAYTHCGISKYEPIEKVGEAMAGAGVKRAVLVQHLGEFDNSYIGGCVELHPDRFAGVCLVDHTAPDAADRLEKFKLSGNFRGVRFPVQVLLDAPDLFHAAAQLRRILVLFAPDGMGSVIEPMRRFLQAHSNANVVLTHLATPRMDEAPEFRGARSAFALAEFPNVYWQLSGMKMYCPWPHEPLYPLIADAFNAFGAERILWGSNYPVVGTAGDYKRDLELLTSGRLPIPTDAIPMIAGENARRLWFPYGETD